MGIVKEVPVGGAGGQDCQTIPWETVSVLEWRSGLSRIMRPTCHSLVSRFFEGIQCALAIDLDCSSVYRSGLLPMSC